MKDCREIREQLSSFLEGEMPADAGGAIEEHLEGCAGCREELELLRLTVTALRSTPDVPPPADIMAAVRRETAPAQTPGLLRRIFGDRLWVGLPAGALALLLVGVAALVLQNRYPDLPEGHLPDAPRERAVTAVSDDVPAEEEDRMVAEKEPPPQPPPFEEPKALVSEGVPAPAAPAVPFAEKAAPPPPQPAAEVRKDLPEPAPSRTPPADPKEPAAAPEPAEVTRPEAAFEKRVETAPAAPAPQAAALPGDPGSYGDTAEETAAEDVRRLLDSSGLLTPPGPAGEVAVPSAVGEPSRETPLSGLEAFGNAGRQEEAAGKSLSRESPPGDAGRDERDFAGEVLGKTKSVPPRGRADGAVALDAEDALQAPAVKQRTAAPGGEFTVTLTLLAAEGDATEALRRHLRGTGGQLLEVRSLDRDASRGIAAELGDKIPPGRSIGRGWYVRALLPTGELERFIALLGEDPGYSILERDRTPAGRRPAPGIRSVNVRILN